MCSFTPTSTTVLINHDNYYVSAVNNRAEVMIIDKRLPYLKYF